MGGSLFVVIASGIVGTGILFHIGRPFSAIVVGLMAYAAARWLWINYA